MQHAIRRMVVMCGAIQNDVSSDGLIACIAFHKNVLITEHEDLSRAPLVGGDATNCPSLPSTAIPVVAFLALLI